MEIKRDSYLEQLKIRKDNVMIKIITGIRRCGKSFLLFVLFKKYLLENGVDNEHIIEIALDGIENEELREPKNCFSIGDRYQTDIAPMLELGGCGILVKQSASLERICCDFETGQLTDCPEYCFFKEEE